MQKFENNPRPPKDCWSRYYKHIQPPHFPQILAAQKIVRQIAHADESLRLLPCGSKKTPSHSTIISSFPYEAVSWKTAWRVVAKVEHHAGELFPRIGFIVTNLEMPNRAVVRFSITSGHGRAVDQGGQVGGKDDAAELPPRGTISSAVTALRR